MDGSTKLKTQGPLGHFENVLPRIGGTSKFPRSRRSPLAGNDCKTCQTKISKTVVYDRDGMWPTITKLSCMNTMKIIPTLTALFIGLASFLLFLAAAEGQQKPAITITETGVGPINAKTPFNIAVLKRLFPGYRVVAGTGSYEGMDYPIIKVMDGTSELLEITSDGDSKAIFSISTTSPRVTLDGKGVIGLLYSEVFGKEVSPHCYEGKENDSGLVFCHRPASSHIGFVFDGVSDDPFSDMPSIAALRKWRVKEIFWKPDYPQ
jgi:hypothetical protein